MNGPVFVVLLSAVAAVAVVFVLLRSHTPDGGYLTWIKEAFSAQHETLENGDSGQRQSREALRDGFEAPDSGQGLHVADILAMAEDGRAYQEAVDLRRVVHRTRVTR